MFYLFRASAEMPARLKCSLMNLSRVSYLSTKSFILEDSASNFR